MAGRGKLKTATVIFLGVLFFGLSMAHGEIPETISYQGYLEDTNTGAPLNGDYDIYFAMYPDQSGVGDELWGEWHIGVKVTKGFIALQLASVVAFPPSLFESSELYLELTVRNAEGVTEKLAPMMPITSTPFAIKAGDSDQLGGYAADAFAADVHGHTWTQIVNRPLGLDDGDDVGITTESDPTVPTSVKDGVSWSEVSDIPADLLDGDNVGLTAEVDPTVPAELKNGVSWEEVSGIPSDILDGDNVGLTSESDPQVGGNTTNYVPRWNGSALVSGSIYDNGSVGVGKTNPQDRLDINGNLRLDAGVDQGNFIRFVEGGIMKWAFLYRPWRADSLSIYDEVGGRDAMFFESDTGNVGVGTTSPLGRFHIYGSENNGSSAALVVENLTSKLTKARMFIDGDEIDTKCEGEGCITSDIALHLNSNSSGNVYAATGGGRLVTRVLQITGGGDLSEKFDIGCSRSEPEVKPGMVVSIDPEKPGNLVVSSEAYDRKVAGVVSGAGGVNPGMLMGQVGTIADGTCPVALTGRVYCLADASRWAIEPGDLLTTSETPGHAMKANDHERAQGAILGKAMTTLKGEKGLVLVLVTLQ